MRKKTQEDDSDTNSDNDEQQTTAPIHMPDPVHMPKQENEMPLQRIYLKMKYKLEDPTPLIQIIQYKIIQNMQTLTMKCLKKCQMPNLNLLLQIQMLILH